MVEINVSQLLKSPIGSTRVYDVDDPVDIGDEAPVVKGKVSLLRTNRGILATGRLKADLGLTCSRCISRFATPVVVKMEEEYFPTTDIMSGAAVSVPEDDPGAFTIDGKNVIDLSEAIRQYVLLAVPMKPLCKPDCSGLCPACGGNLNTELCSCQPQIDPRWHKLLEKGEQK